MLDASLFASKMNNGAYMDNSERIAGLRQIVETQPCAQPIFDWMSKRKYQLAEIEVQTLERKFGESRRTLIAFLRALEKLELGHFWTGRHGYESRLELYSHINQVGQAALGIIDDIDIEKDGTLNEAEVIDLHRQLLAHALNRSIGEIKISVT